MGSRKVTAFTLVELLVVVAIIGILIAIVLPSLSFALASARTTVCATQEREMATAWLMYANDNNGRLMPARDYSDPKYYKFWSGRQDKSFASDDDRGYDASKGFMSPYMAVRKVCTCPSWTGKSNNGQLGYGYNWMYFSYSNGPTSGGKWTFTWTNSSQINRPAQKVVIADCARNIKNNQGQLETTPFLSAPSYQYPSFHVRHNQKGNVVWADGHVTGEAPVWNLTNYNCGGQTTIPLAAAKNLSVGDLDLDGKSETDELFDLK